MSTAGPTPDPELAELLEDAPCGFISARPDGTILRMNRTLASWVGRSGSAVTTFQNLLTTPSRMYFATHLAPLLHMQGHFRGVALDLAREDLTPIPTFIDCVQKTGADGSPVSLHMIITDATHRRRYEEELLLARRTAEQAAESERDARELAERASRAKDDVLAIVSHELKTPLSAILGWSHVLRRQAAGNDAIEKGLDVIDRNARVQARLVDDLLDMSRVVSGKLRLQVEHVDLAKVIEGAIETVSPAAHAKQVRLQPTIDSGVLVSGDAARLQQVFWNLLNNAVKFTPKLGFVRIVMRRVNSHIETSVTDSGVGIKPEVVAHVFDRFRQSDSPDARKTAGLGLGLALVKSLVEMHGGTVEAHSEGENKGATFLVNLPSAAVDHDRAQATQSQRALVAPASSDGEMPLRGIKLLLVDDDPDAREALERTLSSSGAQVTVADGSLEALKILERLRPDVLISDIDMPGEDGYELIRRVRMRAEGSRQLPAIALTAKSRVQDRTEALMAGFQVHMAKPVDAHELVVQISSLVSGNRRS